MADVNQTPEQPGAPAPPVVLVGGAQVSLAVIAVIVGFWGFWGFWGIAAARTFLIPLVLASFAFLLVSGLGLQVVQLISVNAAGVARAAPDYTTRFNELQDNFIDWVTLADGDETEGPGEEDPAAGGSPTSGSARWIAVLLSNGGELSEAD